MLDIGSRREMVVNMGERRRNVPRSMTRHILLGILYLGNDTPALHRGPIPRDLQDIVFPLVARRSLGKLGCESFTNRVLTDEIRGRWMFSIIVIPAETKHPLC